MGKKKDERKRRAREDHATGVSGAGDQANTAREGHAKSGHEQAECTQPFGSRESGAPLAGIATAIARQLGTPIGRQMMAAGLMAAAGAISRHDAKPPPKPNAKPGAEPSDARPTPPPAPPPPTPESPAPPEAGAKPAATSTGPYAGDTPEPPRGDAFVLPPEIDRALQSVATGLERFIVGLRKPPSDTTTKS